MPKMTKEEVVRHFKNRSQKSENYTDVFLNTLKVEVCEINVDGRRYLVPRSVGQAVLEIVENPAKNNEMVPLGNIEFRAYLVKTLEFRKEEFRRLSDWSKSVILEEQPDLLKEWENNFSPSLKAQIEKLKLGSQKKELKSSYEPLAF